MAAMIRRRTILLGMAAARLPAAASNGETWKLNSLRRIGGHVPTIEGRPRVLNGAIAFNGVDDAIFLDIHPLGGAREFTWEVVFRPARDGAAEQRFFHLQENGTDNRMLFETRLVGDMWYLDSYLKSGNAAATLVDKEKLHRTGEWHHAAAVCDGREFRNYVNGAQQGAAPIAFEPHKSGRTSLGVRINRVNYFKGEIRMARMTPRVLSPDQFLKR